MFRGPNLAATEKRIFRAFWQDGLLDIVAGTTIVLIGVGWSCGVLIPMLAMPIVGIIVWQSARHRITEPRLGSVVFSARRLHQLRHGLIAILSLGLVVGGNLVTRVWLKRTDSPLATWFAPAIPVTILAAMSLSCAAALGLWRFLVYGILFAAVGLALATAEMEPWWGLVAGGAAVAAWGVIMLVTFLREFPRLPSEAEG
ncbi:MAG: hypothetical protein PVJ57_08810 [Phycisphaerae bacterium]|jgi:hypothetical protein